MTLAVIFIWIIPAIVVLVPIVLVINPQPLIPFLAKYLNLPEWDPSPEAVVKENYTLYASDGKQKMIAVFTSDLFVLNDLKTTYGFTNELYSRVKDDFDVVVLKYPLRMKSSLRDSIVHFGETLCKDFLHYRYWHAISFSTATLLTGTFMHKERDATFSRQIEVPQVGIKFSSFVGICGVYNTQYNNGIIDALFKFYILKNSTRGHLYSCYDPQVPTLLLSSQSDLFISQTRQFVAAHSCRIEMYPRDLPHLFMKLIDQKESQNGMNKIVEFIKQAQEQGDF
ncbi:GbNV_gp19-like [Fopius arisanus]|nr:GbNV_gp19-like [Fopius arisanus]